ncbi:hypothetical protein [Gordonia mangrovi]|nr:hypothetical protein [Gordonia mangrovi]UVF80944.1 hypothetical protein NWF22_17875 [Gordonia mangrovi]
MERGGVRHRHAPVRPDEDHRLRHGRKHMRRSTAGLFITPIGVIAPTV